MKKVNKILVACDLSNYSIQAVEYAADMAESVNAELVIVNVINQRDLDMIEKVSRHTDKITVSKYVSETREYRSEEIAKVLAASKRDPLYTGRFSGPASRSGRFWPQSRKKKRTFSSWGQKAGPIWQTFFSAPPPRKCFAGAPFRC